MRHLNSFCLGLLLLFLASWPAWSQSARCPGHLVTDDRGDSVCFCPDGSVAAGIDMSGLEFACLQDSRPLLQQYPGAYTSIRDAVPHSSPSTKWSISTSLDALGVHLSQIPDHVAYLVVVLCVIGILAILFGDREQSASPGALVPFPTDDKIFLKLKRSQRLSVFGRPIFILDARADVSPEVWALIAKYRLGKLVVFDSRARKHNAETAYAHFTDASAVQSLGRSLWANARGIASAAKMAFSLRITVNSLISGRHIECKDLGELLSAEGAMDDACKNLRSYIDTALSFNGSEDVSEY